MEELTFLGKNDYVSEKYCYSLIPCSRVRVILLKLNTFPHIKYMTALLLPRAGLLHSLSGPNFF